MPHLSLAEAARETGKSKATIWRAVKSGRVSASRGDGGDYLIDPAELARAFPLEPGRNGTGKQGKTDNETARSAETVILTERLAAKDELIAELRSQLADVREDRDRWRGQAEAVRLLAAPPSRPNLLGRLLGRRS